MVKFTGFLVKGRDLAFPPKPSFDAIGVQSNKHYYQNLILSWDVNDWDLVWRGRLYYPLQGSGKRKRREMVHASCLKGPKSNR